MPIDAEAYMAGALPTGPWVPRKHPPGGTGGPNNGTDNPNPLIGVGNQRMDPLMMGRMVAFGGGMQLGVGVDASTMNGSRQTFRARRALTSPRSPLGQSHMDAGDYFSQQHRAPTSPTQPSTRGGSRCSKSAPTSPISYGGWANTAQGSPMGMGQQQNSRRLPGSHSSATPSSVVHSRRGYHRTEGFTSYEEDWTRGSGAPRYFDAEHPYDPHPHPHPQPPPTPSVSGSAYRRLATPLRGKAESLPAPPVSPSKIQDDRAYYSQQPRIRPPRVSSLRRDTLDPSVPRVVRINPVVEDIESAPPPPRSPRMATGDSIQLPTPSSQVPPISSDVGAHRKVDRASRIGQTPDAFSTGELYDALPSMSQGRTPGTDYMAAHTQAGSYDRYAMHPAAPVPASSRAPINGPASPNTEQTRGTTTIRTPDYLPQAFPRPTRELKWNRDGPVLKTYGVGWHRDGEQSPLSPTPDGPSWVQARPPHAGMVDENHGRGKDWWEESSRV